MVSEEEEMLDEEVVHDFGKLDDKNIPTTSTKFSTEESKRNKRKKERERAAFLNELREIEGELGEWYKYLNTVFSVILFAFIVAAISTPLPAVFSILSFIVCFVGHYQTGKFPPRITQLRKDAKEDRDAKAMLTIVEKQYMTTVDTIKKSPILWIDVFLFIAILLIYWKHDYLRISTYQITMVFSGF